MSCAAASSWSSWSSFAASFVLALSLAEAAPPAQPGVALEKSFAVELEEAGSLSHVPAVVFTPDGKFLFCGTAQGEVIQFDAATREVLRRHRFSDKPIESVAIDAAASVLVWLSGEGVLQAHTLGAEHFGEAAGRVELGKAGQKDAEKDTRQQLTSGGQAAGTMVLSPDGRTLAVANGNSVELRRLPELTLVAGTKSMLGAVTALTWSPDGLGLATADQGGRMNVLETANLEPRYQRDTGAPLYAVSWSPEGSAVAFGGQKNEVYVLDTKDGTDRTTITGQPFWITTLGYSPDGGLLAIGDESCDIWIYDMQDISAADGKPKNLFHGKHHVECWLNGVAWAPDEETFLFGCRPNSLAGKPALWGGNGFAEAFQDEEYQQLLAEEGRTSEELARKIEASLPADKAKALVDALRARGQSLAHQHGSKVDLDLSAGGQGWYGGYSNSGLPQTITGFAGETAPTSSAAQFVFGAEDGLDQAEGDFVYQNNAAAPANAQATLAGQDPAFATLLEQIAKVEAELNGDAESASLLVSLKELRDKRLETYKTKLEKLNRNFQINVWRCARK